MLDRKYDTVHGPALLRVTGQIKPFARGGVRDCVHFITGRSLVSAVLNCQGPGGIAAQTLETILTRASCTALSRSASC